MTISIEAMSVAKLFFTEWALPTEAERIQKRMTSTVDEMRHFYNSTVPFLEEFIDNLNLVDLDSFSEEETLLGNLCIMLCEVDNPVNKWNSPILKDALDPRELHLKKDFHDTGIVLQMGWESFSGGRFSDPNLDNRN